LVGRLQNKAKEFFLKVFVAATTLGDTMVKLKLSEWTFSMKNNSNTSGSILQFLVHIGFTLA